MTEKVKVRYIGCSDMQAGWGQSEDPRPHLKVGNVYTVHKKEIHSWHTVLHLVDQPQGPFNSVCFEDVV